MISNLGTTVAYRDNLGDQVVNNWICLDCGYKMTTNVHWDHLRNRGHMPQKCPNCGTYCNSERKEGEKHG